MSLDIGVFAGPRIAEKDTFTLSVAPEENLEAVAEELLEATDEKRSAGEILVQPMPILPQVMPALPTFFDAENNINYQAQEELMHYLVSQGIRGFLAMGTTGESSLMTFEEHERVIRHAIKVAREISEKMDENICVVAGTGANWTAEQNYLSQAASEMGASANLILPPYYIKSQSEANLLRHLWTALDRGPGIVYRVSARTNIDISDDIIEQLMQHPHFLGVKECEGRVENLVSLFEHTDHQVWSGEDGDVADHINQGAYGSISVTANIHPELVLSVNDAATTNWRRHKAAKYLAEIMFTFGNPSTVHSVGEMVRQANGHDEVRGFRDPVRSLIGSQRRWTLSVLNKVGVTNASDYSNDQIVNFAHHR